ncbi:zinc-binding alcohol dehydrogenase family protein [Burkholderia perseverans]|uniref:zinc-binding alcohol dehydrogenase family protein n=1 Tax=Burkholderia perseverans TaxID=2615214 RepID=UPI001FED90A9|nr:zinc-binding alcohol dehydrogenase family protein [Burkholderia perseverans]
MTDTMRAVVLRTTGGPEVLKIESRLVPQPQPGQVLIRVKAFGLNRSEMFIRRGEHFRPALPRVLGIEAVGVVEAAPGGEFVPGTVVATAMGGMGGQFDGSYADFTLVPARQVLAIKATLPWEVLGAIPEMLHTAWGSLFQALRLETGERLLIRGGTTSVGLAAAAIAKRHGAFVAATTRRPDRENLLRSNGADQVFIDDGHVANQIGEVDKNGFDKVLELVGATALKDSLKCARPRGIVCMTGFVDNEPAFKDFMPMDAIPHTVCLTDFRTTVAKFVDAPIDEMADQIARGELHVPVGRTFRLDEIVEAHRCMEANMAGGKIVVLP